MGEVDFLQFWKCISASVLRPISEKLHSVTLLYDTTNWQSIGCCTHFYTTWHDLWTCSKNRYLHYGKRCWLFPIFKMHLSVSTPAISWEKNAFYSVTLSRASILNQRKYPEVVFTTQMVVSKVLSQTASDTRKNVFLLTFQLLKNSNTWLAAVSRCTRVDIHRMRCKNLKILNVVVRQSMFGSNLFWYQLTFLAPSTKILDIWLFPKHVHATNTARYSVLNITFEM